MTADMPDPVKIEHALNELCDFATSAIEWLRNIRDEISPPSGALATMEQEWKRVSPLAQAAFANARAMQAAMAGSEVRHWVVDDGPYDAQVFTHRDTAEAWANTNGGRVYAAILSSFEPAGAQEGAEVPEPLYKRVEAILDEHSAWIAQPNAEVAKRIALAAMFSAYSLLTEDEAPEDRYLRDGAEEPTPAPDVPGLVERLRSNVGQYQRGVLSLDDIEKDEDEAADALEALQAEVAKQLGRAEGQWAGWVKADCQLRAAEAERDKLRAEVERKDKALRALLDCPDIADNDYKDEETHAAEREARAALSPAKGG